MVQRKAIKKRENGTKGVTMVEVIVAFAVIMLCMTMVSGAIQIGGVLQARAQEYRVKTQEMAAAVGTDLADDGMRSTDTLAPYSAVFTDISGRSFVVQGHTAEERVNAGEETYTVKVFTN